MKNIIHFFACKIKMIVLKIPVKNIIYSMDKNFSFSFIYMASLDKIMSILNQSMLK